VKVSSRWSQRLARRSLEQLRGSRLPAVEDIDRLEALVRRRVLEISREYFIEKLPLLRVAIATAPLTAGSSVAAVAALSGGEAAYVVLLGLSTAMFSILLPVIALPELGDFAERVTDSAGKITGGELLEVFGGTRAVPLRLARREFDGDSFSSAHSIKSALSWELTQLSDRQRQYLRGHLNSSLTIGELLAAFESCGLDPE
jgi:hypothetical protein